jgi:3-deoxy-D-manno-octulosonic-acid transferase
MHRLAYNIVLVVLAPIWLPWMFLRSKKRREAPNWNERFGRIDLPKKTKPRIWLHAVSVGEIVAAQPILSALRESLGHTAEIVVSTTTSSGQQTARKFANGLIDHLFYFPVDLPWVQRRAQQALDADILVVMETELWMNTFFLAKRRGCPVVIANGRLSNSSFAKASHHKGFYTALLSYVDVCLAQSQGDAARFRELGCNEVRVSGNTKFDEAGHLTQADPAEWREKLGLGNSQVVVVGSTRSEMEEELVVAGLARLSSKPKIIHAPRHIETWERLKLTAERQFLSVGLRSKNETVDYLILDTYGELGSVYCVADVAIVGGGFDKLGGQNIIQALALGKPVIHGPHMFNFKDVAIASLESGASVECSTLSELTTQVELLLDSGEERKKRGAAARRLVQENLGASERISAAISELLSGRVK